MNILMIGALELQGGITTVIKNYKESNVYNTKCSVVYISTGCEGSKIKKLYKAVISLIRYTICLTTKKVDIVHVHLGLGGSLARKKYFIGLASILNKKIIIHFHASELTEVIKTESKRKQIEKVLKKASNIIALNQEIKDQLKKVSNIDSVILHNFTPKVDYIYNHNSKKVLMLSRLTKEKGTFDLIDAIRMLRDEDITFVLAGTSNEIDLIKQKIEENNLNNKVEILGWVSDKEKLFKDCFASILPSYNECIPMGILESMSYGVPCIATNVGGIPEIITIRKMEY